jgi:hypothetical protein
MRWIVSFSACLLLAGCGDSVNVRGDTPEPYNLSCCTQEFMKAQHATKALPRCVAADWNEVTESRARRYRNPVWVRTRNGFCSRTLSLKWRL